MSETPPDLVAELVKTLAPLADALLPLLLTVLTWASYQAAAWIRSKITSEFARRTLLGLGDLSETVVREMAQTTVEQLKVAAADGKLTEEEVDEVRRAALGTLKSYLGPKGLKAVSDVIGAKDAKSVDRFLTGSLEAKLHELKASPFGFARLRED